MKEFEEKTLSVTPIFDGKVIKVRTEKVELPDGREANRELIAHNGGVGVIAVTDEGEVFMVSQYRIAARSMMLEVPAGKLEEGEDPLECGKRELIEETGYKGNKFTYLGTYYATPGYCEEKISLYLAQELEWVGQNLDEGEFLNVKKYKLDDLYNMVMNNEIKDAKTAVAILKAKGLVG
ncbi:MAG: NUDIX hydrolase [Clostridiales bacterium]|nr:NUDIX hydrolase [Clostridiales bacterium]